MNDILSIMQENNTERMQENHLLVEHILCESIEASFLNT